MLGKDARLKGAPASEAALFNTNLPFAQMERMIHGAGSLCDVLCHLTRLPRPRQFDIFSVVGVPPRGQE